jgi:hypothetical protein
VSDGWKRIETLDVFSLEPYVPHPKRTGHKVEPGYDYRNELGDFW